MHARNTVGASERNISDASVHILSKWKLIAWYWASQAALVLLVAPLWLMQGESVRGPEQPLGQWKWDWVLRVLSSWEYWGSVLGVIATLMVLQSVLVWPVRRPRARNRKGVPLWASVGAGALLGTMLAAAIFFGLGTILQINEEIRPRWLRDSNLMGWVFAAWCSGSFVAGSVLMYGFCLKRLRFGDRHEQVLAKVAATLFKGTLVEAVAILPLDVMFRRKSDCYCFAGTFWAFTLLIGAGLVTIGPAIFLPVLARRRKEWYGSRCDCCGYDMSGLDLRGVERCPECGAGWRREAREVCTRCGYDLRGIPTVDGVTRCPECGEEIR